MKTICFVKENMHLSRNSFMDFGWGNGYVGVTKENPLYGIDYTLVDSFVVIHGGLTFSGMIDNMWCFGFDTAHSGDTLLKWPETAVLSEANRLKLQIDKLSKAQVKKIKWDSNTMKTTT
jgi:hypothetical protein